MNASIRKRRWISGGTEKTAWQVSYPFKGKRVTRQFATKGEATEFRTDVSWEVKSGTHTPRNKSITVAEAVADWLQHAEAEQLEAQTVRTYRAVADHHVLPILGDHKLADLTRPMLEQYRDDLLTGSVPGGKPRSRIMARKALGCLKAVIGEAMRRGKVGQNVAGDVKVGRNRVEDDDAGHREIGVDVPAKEDVNAILAAASPRWRPLIITAAFCGLRSSELRGLRSSDIDFDQKMLRVRQRADRWGNMGPPKSKAGRRDVPMIAPVVNALREWKLACPIGALVFPGPNGRVMDHAQVYRQAFGGAQLACGITRPQLDDNGQPVTRLNRKTGQRVPVLVAKYSVHAFRHFAASYFIDKELSPKQVMTLMGHASFEMSMTLYGHMFPVDEGLHAKLEGKPTIALVG